MKNMPFWMFLSFLLLASLAACNLPLSSGEISTINSIEVSPHSSTGSFTAQLRGTISGSHDTEQLVCYVSPDKSTHLYDKALKGKLEVKFNFTYTVKGLHSLVCYLNKEEISQVWSDDFVVADAAVSGTETPSTLSGTWHAKGTVASWAYDPESSCSAQTSIDLTVRPDGSADLSLRYPAFNLFKSCETQDYDTNLSIPAQLSDPASGTVMITQCGSGTYQGQLTISNGQLSGHITCYHSNPFSSRDDQKTFELTVP